MPRTEPVMWTDAISGLILTGLAFLIGRGLINWTSDDVGNFAAFLSYLIPLAVVVIGGLIARQFTTPVADPKLSDDEPLMTRAEWDKLDDAERRQ